MTALNPEQHSLTEAEHQRIFERRIVPALFSDAQATDRPVGVMRELDKWLRHRLRAVQLKQWRRGTTMFRELHRLGASVDLAARIAGYARRWWRNSAMSLNIVMPIAYFDRLGVPRFS